MVLGRVIGPPRKVENPMSTENHPELERLAAALAALAPASGRLDRDQLMFRAGQASVARSRLWPASTAVLAATLLVVVGSWARVGLRTEPTTGPLVQRPAEGPRPIQPTAEAPTSESPPAPVRSAAGHFVGPDQQAVRLGIESLPIPRPTFRSNFTPRLDELLGEPVRPREAPSWLPLGSLLSKGEKS